MRKESTMTDTNAVLYAIAFLFALTLTVLIGRLIIPLLKDRAEQPIYTEGPSWHVSKAGTPTMGGLSFMIAISFTLLLCSLYEVISKSSDRSLSLLICTLYALSNALVGIIDDRTKLRRKKNGGLSARAKLIAQFTLSALFLIARSYILGEGTSLTTVFGIFDIGPLYYVIALVILVGITNCANLTDGIDGLASSVAFAIGISTFIISYGISDSASFISAALAAGALGFLIFNLHPAAIFMGDTGSLFLGAVVASLAFELKNPFISVISGGVYVIEGVSVILQVIFYKITKKRLFKMAPIHHHLEKCGWDENKICIVATVLTLIFGATLRICIV